LDEWFYAQQFLCETGCPTPSAEARQITLEHQTLQQLPNAFDKICSLTADEC
jgi:hypothetical protein